MASMPTNGSVNHQEQAAAPNSSSQTSDSNSLSKDEVGWYFVEQYYTTLSKNPERLHLFYGKTSQFVYGLEAEIANVSVGRQQIQDRIKALDLQDCKVRVSNVDSQASEDSIVIQVIGETVNKGGEPKKFVQTFVLAKQPSGYFVLNDILRYINDDVEEDATETAAAAADETADAETQPAAEPEAAAIEPEAPKEADAPVEVEAEAVSKTEEAKTAKDAAAPEPSAPVADVAPSKAESIPEPEKIAQEIAEEDIKKPEVPKDPSPTPVAPRPAAPAAPAAAEPEKPKEPSKPMTWASRIAAAAGPARPAVALPKPAVPAATPAARPAAAAAAAAATPAPAASTAPAPAAAVSKPAAPAAAPDASAAQESGNEWQTAGVDSKRQNRPQSGAAPQEDKGTLGYVKFVNEKVKSETLKSQLSSFGDLVYFEINRQKNCAFIEFASPAGYNAAAAANPHTVDGVQVYVEPRRPKASAYGGSNYSNRGGSISGRGRGGFDGNRSGSQGGRGGFNNQGRGRGGAPRGRGGVSQATNA